MKNKKNPLLSLFLLAVSFCRIAAMSPAGNSCDRLLGHRFVLKEIIVFSLSETPSRELLHFALTSKSFYTITQDIYQTHYPKLTKKQLATLPQKSLYLILKLANNKRLLQQKETLPLESYKYIIPAHAITGNKEIKAYLDTIIKNTLLGLCENELVNKTLCEDETLETVADVLICLVTYGYFGKSPSLARNNVLKAIEQCIPTLLEQGEAFSFQKEIPKILQQAQDAK